ncbi:DUF2332 domain-containing protein [Erythrobacter rubeus]|uniref:DUF2332 domain-containing protein n=1 Tax=Erythrobacter rubeus TaxID=2760803 RepID=A0ABR8KRC0_9SPHN|nr:DUF2332 domain-containing protein [Erythrobacter rubeus]MBD2841880.1 DUF2332 domain-containing protein [Erythrobacter rubeus]
MNDQQMREIARWYEWFSVHEAKGHSSLWADITAQVALDSEILEFLSDLPQPKRQPNLFLASYRSLFGTPADWSTFRAQLLAEPTKVADRMRERSTQTNEPGRCAVLLPVLARLRQPLALIEVGASAGLCLLPDFYAYDYGQGELLPHGQKAPPLFKCAASANTPIPEKMPNIVWRAGLDLNPLDVCNAEEMAWLETLVWPGQEERLARLRKSSAIAQQQLPRVVQGNLSDDLETLLNDVPIGLTTVVFHSAVLNYLGTQKKRDDFERLVTATADHWISNESPKVLPQLAAKAPAQSKDGFLLSLDGRPVAWTDPHGAWLDWIEG